MPGRAAAARAQSLRPGRSFWAIAWSLSALCVAIFLLTGLAATPAGRLASDILGMGGALGLVYGTARSLPTRERIENLMTLATAGEKDAVVAEVLEQFPQGAFGDCPTEHPARVVHHDHGRVCASDELRHIFRGDPGGRFLKKTAASAG